MAWAVSRAQCSCQLLFECSQASAAVCHAQHQVSDRSALFGSSSGSQTTRLVLTPRLADRCWRRKGLGSGAEKCCSACDVQAGYWLPLHGGEWACTTQHALNAASTMLVNPSQEYVVQETVQCLALGASQLWPGCSLLLCLPGLPDWFGRGACTYCLLCLVAVTAFSQQALVKRTTAALHTCACKLVGCAMRSLVSMLWLARPLTVGQLDIMAWCCKRVADGIESDAGIWSDSVYIIQCMNVHSTTELTHARQMVCMQCLIAIYTSTIDHPLHV